MFHNHDELFGGFRGLCWRARHGQQLYDTENIATINHAKFMFYMTSLIEDNTTSTNQKLFNIFNEIHLKMEGGTEYERDGGIFVIEVLHR